MSALPGDNSSTAAPLSVLRFAHHGVVSAWRQRERDLIRLGVDVHTVSSRRWNEGGSDIVFDAESDTFAEAVPTVGRHPSVFLMAPRRLWHLLGQKWDLIDLHEEPNALITGEVLFLRWIRRNKAPFVLYSAQNIPKRYPPPFSWIERWALRNAAGAYVCNSEAGHILRGKGLRPTAQLIGLGVDTGRFHPSGSRSDGSLSRIGYAGRLEQHKGVAVLLHALSELPTLKLRVAGDGPQRPELEALARELGLVDRVDFLGNVGAALPDFYRSVEAIVVPSLPTRSWLEQFCRVAVEAMASGVPVVASATGAIPDVIGDAGLLVPPGDPGAIANALRRLADDSVRQSARDRGLVQAQQFDWPEVARQQRDLYLSATSGRPQPGAAQALPEVVIVAYGASEPLEKSIARLDSRFPVTIVDNSSNPDSAAVAARTGASYIDPGANLGFAAGVNLAFRSLRDRGRDQSDVLLLNPDAEIDPDELLELQRHLHASQRIACIAPHQLSPVTGEPEHVTWPFPHPAAAWVEAVGLGRLDRRRGFVIGSILLINREALDDVGDFDEGFFLYAEETDWQYRAARRGWTIAFAPHVTGLHVGAGTGGDSLVRLEHFHRSQMTYIRKHYGRIGALVYRWAAIAGSTVRSFVGPAERRQSSRRRLRIYLTGGSADG